MNTSCYAVNIRSTIDKNDNAYIGEDALNLLIDGFSCPPNLEVEHFLKHSALDFTKKNQSVTYLAFRPATHGDIFAGYYSLAIKPISVRASAISKTMGSSAASAMDRGGFSLTASPSQLPDSFGNVRFLAQALQPSVGIPRLFGSCPNDNRLFPYRSKELHLWD